MKHIHSYVPIITKSSLAAHCDVVWQHGQSSPSVTGLRLAGAILSVTLQRRSVQLLLRLLWCLWQCSWMRFRYYNTFPPGCQVSLFCLSFSIPISLSGGGFKRKLPQWIKASYEAYEVPFTAAKAACVCLVPIHWLRHSMCLSGSKICAAFTCVKYFEQEGLRSRNHGRHCKIRGSDHVCGWVPSSCILLFSNLTFDSWSRYRTLPS